MFNYAKPLLLYFTDMFSGYTKFVTSVQQLLQGDSIILMLLVAITLFSVDRTVVKEKEKVFWIIEINSLPALPMTINCIV